MIVVDPWLINNPKTPPRDKDLDAVGRVFKIYHVRDTALFGDMRLIATTTSRT